MQTVVVPVSLLLAASGLSRPTVLGAMAQLASIAPTTEAGVTIPGDLLQDRRIGARARVLYGVLQSLHGQCTYAQLSSLTGTSLPAVRRAARELISTGWMEARQASRLAPISLARRGPHAGVSLPPDRLGSLRASRQHSAAKVTIQRARDHDLSLAGMLQKVGDALPLRDLRGQDQVIELLEVAARRYQTSDREVQ